MQTRPRWSRTALVAAVAFGVSACERLTAPNPNFVWQSSAELISVTTSVLDSADAGPRITVSDGAITVRGYATTRYLCDRLKVDATTYGQVIVVGVHVLPHAGGCFTAIGVHEFVATAVHRRGQYRLQFRNEGACCGSEARPMLDTIITVP